MDKSELEKTEIAHCRPAHHRALDPARVGESDKHDRGEEFWVVFEGKVRDQLHEQIFKPTVHEEILDKHHREWCDRVSLALASVVIHCGYRTLKTELWESVHSRYVTMQQRRPVHLCTQQTEQSHGASDRQG